MLRRRYADELSNLEALRRESRQRAQEEARALIKRAQDKVDNTLAELRRAQTEGKQTERVRQKIKDIGSDLQAAIQDKLSADQPAALEFVPDRPLRRGDQVRITTLGMAGELLEDAQGDSPVPVQVGAMRVSVPPSTLMLLGAEPRPVKVPSVRPESTPLPRSAENLSTGKDGDVPSFSMEKTIGITPQLTLLGQRAEEAIQNVEKYLDDAYAAGLSRARLVHRQRHRGAAPCRPRVRQLPPPRHRLRHRRPRRRRRRRHRRDIAGNIRYDGIKGSKRWSKYSQKPILGFRINEKRPQYAVTSRKSLKRIPRRTAQSLSSPRDAFSSWRSYTMLTFRAKSKRCSIISCFRV